jgi:hypothetical protein
MECLGRGERFSGFVEAIGLRVVLLKSKHQVKSPGGGSLSLAATSPRK